MTSFSRSSFASILLFTALVAVPLGGCGGTAVSSSTTTGSGGSGGAGSSSSATGSTSSTGTGGAESGCAGFCVSLLACTTPETCVLVDAAAAQGACVSSCETAQAALSAAEQGLVDTCLACFKKVSDGKCFLTLPMSSCATECEASAPSAAMKKWEDAVGAAPLDPKANCTNGDNVLASQDCSISSGTTTCSMQCCNQTCGATPDVAADCTMPSSGPSTCTCTAGKNKGKTFTPTGGACPADSLWNDCNL